MQLSLLSLDMNSSNPTRLAAMAFLGTVELPDKSERAAQAELHPESPDRAGCRPTRIVGKYGGSKSNDDIAINSGVGVFRRFSREPSQYGSFAKVGGKTSLPGEGERQVRQRDQLLETQTEGKKRLTGDEYQRRRPESCRDP